MIIGIPKEIKVEENRVSITPAGVHDFIQAGHEVIVEKGAGNGSGFTDKEYTNEGASLVNKPSEVFSNAEMIIKVKEPQPEEIDLFQKNQILYTYLHLAASKKLTEDLLKKENLFLVAIT